MSLNTSLSTGFSIIDNFSIEIGVNYSHGLIDIYEKKLKITTMQNGVKNSIQKEISVKTRSVGAFTIFKYKL